MKKQLLTVGDSFTYGDELTDRYQAWPYKLADAVDYEVHNMGQSGTSNTSILRRTLEELAINHYDLVIIGWSDPGRVEWKDNVGIAYDVWPGFRTNGQFIKDHPWRLSLAEYVSGYHSPEYLYQQYLINVLSLQSYCKVKNIDLLMMDIRGVNYYRSVGAEQHDKLADQINKDQFVGWGEFGMLELCTGLPKGPGGHPLEKGHERIANEFKKHIRN